MVAVQVGEDRCHLRAEDTQQGQLAGLEKGDIKSRVAGSGGGFQPDPAGADDGDPLCPGEPGLDALTVLDAAQIADAVEICACTLTRRMVCVEQVRYGAPPAVRGRLSG
jgi:hypothetical protein